MKKRIVIYLLILLVIIIMVVILKKNGLIFSNNEKTSNENIEEEIQIAKADVSVGENEELQEDGSKINKSEELKKTKKLEDEYELTKIQLKENGGITMLTAEVKNVSKKSTKEQEVCVELLDKNKNVIDTIHGGIIKALEPEETTILNMGVTIDTSNAYTFRIKKV